MMRWAMAGIAQTNSVKTIANFFIGRSSAQRQQRIAAYLVPSRKRYGRFAPADRLTFSASRAGPILQRDGDPLELVVDAPRFRHLLFVKLDQRGARRRTGVHSPAAHEVNKEGENDQHRQPANDGANGLLTHRKSPRPS